MSSVIRESTVPHYAMAALALVAAAGACFMDAAWGVRLLFIAIFGLPGLFLLLCGPRKTVAISDSGIAIYDQFLGRTSTLYPWKDLSRVGVYQFPADAANGASLVPVLLLEFRDPEGPARPLNRSEARTLRSLKRQSYGFPSANQLAFGLSSTPWDKLQSALAGATQTRVHSGERLTDHPGYTYDVVPSSSQDGAPAGDSLPQATS